MKSRLAKGSFFIVFCLFFALAGCTSKPAVYQFTPEESNAASISFKTGNPSVSFVSFQGKTLPAAEKGTHWEPILLPAGRPFLVTVHAHHEYKQKVWAKGGVLGAISGVADIVGTTTRYVNTDVVLTCPTLMPGAKYELSFKKEAGIPGKNFLVLTDLSTKKVIYEQEFETKENK